MGSRPLVDVREAAVYTERVGELGLVAALLGALVALPALFTVVPWELAFGGGLALVALGMAIGVPAGALYHLALWRALKPARGWWLHPTALHPRLGDGHRGRVFFWFRIGAAGFLAALLGCALVAVGALRAR